MNTLAQKPNSTTRQVVRGGAAVVQADFEPEFGRTFGGRAAEAVSPHAAFNPNWSINSYMQALLRMAFTASSMAQDQDRAIVLITTMHAGWSLSHIQEGRLRAALGDGRLCRSHILRISDPHDYYRSVYMTACDNLIGRLEYELTKGAQ